MTIKSVLSLALCLLSAFGLSIADDISDTKCTRGDNKIGRCKNIKICPLIYDLNSKLQEGVSITPEEKAYILNSKCDIPKTDFVCCEDTTSLTRGMQILKDQYCGVPHSTELTFDGQEIHLMARPWMALLKLKTEYGKNMYACAGTLITNRYVMTSASCLKDQELLSVRLGEHDVSNEMDCYLFKGKQKCSPPIEELGVDRIFIHEDYSTDTKSNDIALIKLAKYVELKETYFPESIRPICLPVNKTLYNRGEELREYRVTGWGKMNNESFSDVPMETFVSRKHRSLCQELYQMNVTMNQICAGNRGNENCNVDSGGPLLYLSKYYEAIRFVQFGIFSYGSNECGNKIPGVYTNVGSYLPWIAEKIVN